MLFTREKSFEPVLLHFSLDIINSFLALNEDRQMISHNELFSSRSLTLNPRFLQLAHPDREILVRESYSIISIHYWLEAKRFQQSLVKILRLLQVGDFVFNINT